MATAPQIAPVSNRLTHGFRSSTVLLPGDDPTEYAELLDELTTHFNPNDLTEARFVREMADADWRLRRVRRLMESAVARHMEKIAAENTGPALDPISLQSSAIETLAETGCSFGTWLRYESKFERQYDRAYQSWTRYQEQRRRVSAREADIAMKQVLFAPTPSAGPQLVPAPAIQAPAASNVQNVISQQHAQLIPVMPARSEEHPVPIARNALCPCGSGEKYKRCCGRAATGLIHNPTPDRNARIARERTATATAPSVGRR